jgi:hypothetical protein
MPDNWNPKEPSASFRRFAEDLRDESKRVLLRDGITRSYSSLSASMASHA